MKAYPHPLAMSIAEILKTALAGTARKNVIATHFESR